MTDQLVIAAAEWARLHEEIERLTRELAEAHRKLNAALVEATDYQAERDAARAVVDGIAQTHAGVTADRDRLRAALQSIAANTCCDRCQEAALVAQAALRQRNEALSSMVDEQALVERLTAERDAALALLRRLMRELRALDLNVGLNPELLADIDALLASKERP